MTPMPSPADVIASPSNPRIKAAARLRDRRQRDATKLTLVDGAREVRRALDSGVDVVEAFVCEPLLAGEDARGANRRAGRTGHPGDPHDPVPRSRRSPSAISADGIVAVIRIPSLLLDGLTLPAEPLIVVVEGVEKPATSAPCSGARTARGPTPCSSHPRAPTS